MAGENDNVENVDNLDSAPVEQQGGQAAQEWSGPSQEDWQQLVQTNRLLQGKLQELEQSFQPPEDEGMEFPDEIDLSDPYMMAQLIDAVVSSRLEGITPYVKNAAQDQGRREMEEMFTKLESKYGSFDHALAERAAFYNYDQTKDPVLSVEEAARYAAQVRQSERDAREAEMKQKASRRGLGASSDLATSGSATPGESLKTYDDVLEKWNHQSEI